MTVQEVYLQKVQVPKVDGAVVGEPKILAEYKISEPNGLSYTFSKINYGGRTYELYSPLQCKWEIDEDNVFIIEHEILSLVGTGMNLEEAAKSFEEEFDYGYYIYNKHDDSKLGAHLLRAKRFINIIVKKVEE